LVVSAALVAVTVTEPEGTVDGAVYKPEVDMVPAVEFPPVMPFTDQVAAALVAPLTVALNSCV
jgi:hypothetical protein